MERYRLVMLIVAAFVALSGFVELLTGALVDDRRLAFVMLAASALGLSAVWSSWRLTRSLRSEQAPRRRTAAQSVAAAVGVGISIAANAVIGFAFFGRWGAIVLPAAAVALLLVAGVIIARQRQSGV